MGRYVNLCIGQRFFWRCHVDGATAQKLLGTSVCSDSGRILGELGETMPRLKTLSELFAVERRAQQMSLEREVLPDRSKAREKGLSALWVAKSAQAPLTFTRRLMAEPV